MPLSWRRGPNCRKRVRIWKSSPAPAPTSAAASPAREPRIPAKAAGMKGLITGTQKLAPQAEPLGAVTPVVGAGDGASDDAEWYDVKRISPYAVTYWLMS